MNFLFIIGFNQKMTDVVADKFVAFFAWMDVIDEE